MSAETWLWLRVDIAMFVCLGIFILTVEALLPRKPKHRRKK